MIEHIKRAVSEFLAQFTTTKYGQVSAYNPNDYTVKVMLMPTMEETGFVPLSAPWVGNNFGAVFGPAIGDSVRLDFVDGRIEACLVGGRFFNDSARPPVVQSGQAAIVDSQGSYIKLNNDGTVTVNAATTMTLTAINVNVDASTQCAINSPNIILNGPIEQGQGSNAGNASMGGTLTVGQDVKLGNGTTLGTHYHSDSGGSGNGGPPVAGS